MNTILWIWMEHIIAVLLVFALGGLPSLYIKKIVERHSLHRPLGADEIDEVRFLERTLEDAEQEQFRQAFNASVFLLRRQHPVHYSSPGVQVQLKDGDTLSVYPYQGELDIVRRRGPARGRWSREATPKVYQVRGEALVQWILIRSS